jgi:hypothetical protein
MTISQDIESSYELSDGGFVPEFDGIIREATFCFDNSYNNGETAVLEVLVEPSAEDAPEFGDYLEDGLYRILYPCGKGWEPADKGATVQHDSGRARRFGAQSGIGLLLSHALGIDGVADVLKSRGPATQASIWIGLNFRFLDKQFSYEANGETRTYNRRLPVEFHGTDEGAKATAKKAPAKKAPAKPAADDGEGDGLSPKLRGQLRAIAAKTEDHDSFMEAAFAEIPDMGDDAEASVADESFYLSLKAG